MKPTIPESEGSIKDIRERGDRLQIALHKTFGMTQDLKTVPGARGLQRVVQGHFLPQEIPAFSGLREAYVALTGDDTCSRIGKCSVTQI